MRREGNALCQSAKRSVTSDYYYYSGILFFCVINLSFQTFFHLKYSQFNWIVGIFFISSLKVRDKMLVFWWFIRFFFFHFHYLLHLISHALNFSCCWCIVVQITDTETIKFLWRNITFIVLCQRSHSKKMSLDLGKKIPLLKTPLNLPWWKWWPPATQGGLKASWLSVSWRMSDNVNWK